MMATMETNMTENPSFPITAWQAAVKGGELRGYDEWCEAQAAAKPSDPQKRYGIRLWATFRCCAETEIEAESLEAATEIARGQKFESFDFGDRENMTLDGDETAHIYEPNEDDDYVWENEAGEVDLRKEGEPFSWEAVKIVKKLAELNAKRIENPELYIGDEAYALMNEASRACIVGPTGGQEG
jgi:hypothetical protein